MICKEHCAKFWYSRVDFQNFRIETQDRVQHLRTVSAHDDEISAWANDNALVYCLFCEFQNAQQLHSRLPKITRTVGAETCGMERRATASISTDASARRRQLTREIFSWQDRGASEQTLLKLSRRITRPSRLYARHVAVVSSASP